MKRTHTHPTPHGIYTNKIVQIYIYIYMYINQSHRVFRIEEWGGVVREREQIMKGEREGTAPKTGKKNGDNIAETQH